MCRNSAEAVVLVRQAWEEIKHPVWVAGKGKELVKKLSEWQKKCLSDLENRIRNLFLNSPEKLATFDLQKTLSS